MIPDSIDISSGVSSNLSALIESRVSDPDAPQPVTLASVRTYLAAREQKRVKEKKHKVQASVRKQQ